MKLITCNEKKLKKLIKNGNKFVCFGVGNSLKKLCMSTGLEEHIELIFDNNTALWNKECEINNKLLTVCSPEFEKIPSDTIFLITTAYYEQVVDKLSKLDNWSNIKKAYYFPSKEDKNYNCFSWILKRLKAQKKILFRSGMQKYVPGFDFTDNAKVLFDYMIENGYNDNYKMVWYVHEPSEFSKLSSVKNVKVVSYEWESSNNFWKAFKYLYHICTAKYVFVTDASFWLRHCNKELLRVNLWHGCGYKDRKTKNGPRSKSFDYMTVISPLYADIHIKEFGCKPEQMLITGLAKQDLLFKKPLKGLDEILNITKAKKYIFWLPTFRMAIEGLERLNEYILDSDTGLPIVKTLEEAKEINEFLEKNDEYLIIKLHPVQKNSIISHIEFSRIKVIENETITSMGLQINNLLSMADAMISDYSSVAVDYMLLDRPMAFMLEDEEMYKNSRGFVFENIHEYLSGKELYNLEDLKTFLNEIGNNIDSEKKKRQKLIRAMHSYQDGNSCKRILDAIDLKNN